MKEDIKNALKEQQAQAQQAQAQQEQQTQNEEAQQEQQQVYPKKMYFLNEDGYQLNENIRAIYVEMDVFTKIIDFELELPGLYVVKTLKGEVIESEFKNYLVKKCDNTYFFSTLQSLEGYKSYANDLASKFFVKKEKSEIDLLREELKSLKNS